MPDRIVHGELGRGLRIIGIELRGTPAYFPAIGKTPQSEELQMFECDVVLPGPVAPEGISAEQQQYLWTQNEVLSLTIHTNRGDINLTANPPPWVAT